MSLFFFFFGVSLGLDAAAMCAYDVCSYRAMSTGTLREDSSRFKSSKANTVYKVAHSKYSSIKLLRLPLRLSRRANILFTLVSSRKKYTSRLSVRADA